MLVSWLELRNFRCHERLRFEPDPGMNVLIGPNGAGKTSVLEAIAFAGSLRSFRRSPEKALVRQGSEETIIRLAVATGSSERRVEIAIPFEGRRRVLLNGKRPQANAELHESLPAVAFLPDDLDVVKGSPGLRRDFLDDLAAQLSPLAAATQADYRRAVRQRNTLLRQLGNRADPTTLDVWDERVADSGGAVVTTRLQLLEELERMVDDAYATVAKASTIAISYRTSWTAVESDWKGQAFSQDLRRALTDRRRRDMEVRATTAGPHRDEPSIELDGRPARTEASQGEQRALALALRLASYSMLEDRHGAAPVLLLDDVFSELDVGRSSGVMDLLPRGQVFVTSAREDEVPVKGRRWIVESGRLS